jgi:hypothetical protein
MKRKSIWAKAGICSALAVTGSPLVLGCTAAGEAGEAPVAAGVFRVPLTTEADGKTYRISNARIRVGGAADTMLYGSDDPSERALVASLPAGDYTSDLENYELERAGRDGKYEPVIGELVSAAHHEFSLLNGTTTTISYQFETDGQIVTVGSGSLRVEVEVVTRPGACTPLGAGCEPGLWCAPSEFTGQPLACVAAGSNAVGERCASPQDCVENSSCFDFGDGEPVCAPLCGSEAFGTACESGGICQPQGSDYGVCAPEGSTGSRCPLTVQFWPASDPMDAVFDDERCRLYVTTAGGTIVRHWLEENRSDGLLDVGTGLRGLDLSPNGEFLVAANATTVWEGSQRTRIHVVELDTESVRELTFPVLGYESGTQTPVFVDDATVFVSSVAPSWGYGPLRRVDIREGGSSVVAEQTRNLLLATTADRQQVAVAEPGNWNGLFGWYPADGGSGFVQSTNASVSGVAVSRDGARFALPSSNGLSIYDENLYLVATLNKDWSSQPVGAVYSPDSDVLYVSWGGATSIDAYDALTLEPLFTVDDGMAFGYSSFGPGRLRISQDGRLLLALVSGGVMTYPVQFN